MCKACASYGCPPQAFQTLHCGSSAVDCTILKLGEQSTMVVQRKVVRQLRKADPTKVDKEVDIENGL